MQTRQQEILNLIVKEYIKTAEPVGSRFLVENCNLDISPATVRNEMGELEEGGYLFQPHTSAGRIPTDKGYRFFVDRITVGIATEKKQNNRIRDTLAKKMRAEEAHDMGRLARDLAKEISVFSRSVGVCGFYGPENFYFPKGNKVPATQGFYSSGLSNLFEEPEFAAFPDPAAILKIFDSLDEQFEKIFERIENKVEIFIGKENIDKEMDNFSLIVSRCLADEEVGMIGIVGPKRMDYAKNIDLVDCVRELVENF